MSTQITAPAITKWLNLLGHHEYIPQVFASLDSTNSYALTHAQDLKHKSIIIAVDQFQGRGRGDKVWQTNPHHDLTLSLVYRMHINDNYLLLPLITAVGITRLFKQHNIQTAIKWPNDIYYDGHKVAGILVETKLLSISSTSQKLSKNAKNNNAHDPEKNRVVVMGIGINNAMLATKLSSLPLRAMLADRNKQIAELIYHLDSVLLSYLIAGFSVIRREWLDNCIHLNKKVTIHDSRLKAQENNYNSPSLAVGIHVDINDHGELLLKNEQTGQITAYRPNSLCF